jgi:hypothetical protein
MVKLGKPDSFSKNHWIFRGHRRLLKRKPPIFSTENAILSTQKTCSASKGENLPIASKFPLSLTGQNLPNYTRLLVNCRRPFTRLDTNAHAMDKNIDSLAPPA